MLPAMASARLTRHSRDVTGVFDLLGQGENDLTAALAFTLGRSPVLMSSTLRRLLPDRRQLSLPPTAHNSSRYLWLASSWQAVGRRSGRQILL